MVFLIRDVSLNLRKIRFAHREDSITRLPREVGRRSRLPLQPLSGFSLHCLNHIHDSVFPTQQTKRVYVVIDTANEERWRINVVAKKGCHVGVQFISQDRVSQPTLPILGGKHDVNGDLGERLRHG